MSLNSDVITCPVCSGKMTLLLISAVCDYCNPPRGSARTITLDLDMTGTIKQALAAFDALHPRTIRVSNWDRRNIDLYDPSTDYLVGAFDRYVYLKRRLAAWADLEHPSVPNSDIYELTRQLGEEHLLTWVSYAPSFGKSSLWRFICFTPKP